MLNTVSYVLQRYRDQTGHIKRNLMVIGEHRMMVKPVNICINKDNGVGFKAAKTIKCVTKMNPSRFWVSFACGGLP